MGSYSLKDLLVHMVPKPHPHPCHDSLGLNGDGTLPFMQMQITTLPLTGQDKGLLNLKGLIKASVPVFLFKATSQCF